MVRETIDLLGLKARDRVTGFEGVIVSVGFDLFGCVQATINPSVKPDGDIVSPRWFDVNRLDVQTNERVMPVPDFDKERLPSEYRHGSAEKPVMD